MATFHPNHTTPDSLENVLSSLRNILEHNSNQTQSHYEPFSNQPAEQYDDPLILDEPCTSNVSQILQQHIIPVLHDVVEIKKKHSPPLSAANVEKTLLELRTELSDLASDIMIDARQHLEQLDVSSQYVMEASLKRFLHDLIERLPR